MVSHKVQWLGLYYLSYASDIPDLVNSKVKMFAGDIKIYKQITSFSDALSFQNDLDKLRGWARDDYCSLILLSVNTKKYGSNASPYEYYMNEEGYNSKLNVVPSEKDLGVWITCNLTLHYNVRKLQLKLCNLLV